MLWFLTVFTTRSYSRLVSIRLERQIRHSTDANGHSHASGSLNSASRQTFGPESTRISNAKVGDSLPLPMILSDRRGIMADGNGDRKTLRRHFAKNRCNRNIFLQTGSLRTARGRRGKGRRDLRRRLSQESGRSYSSVRGGDESSLCPSVEKGISFGT